MRRGFSLLEVMIAMTVLTVAILGLVTAIVTSMRLTTTNRENTLAMNAARQKIEEMQAWPGGFSEVFAAYNNATGDDAGLAAAAPGGAFTVAGLRPITGDPAVGTIIFNVDSSGPGSESLREFSVDPTFGPMMGMPKDISGDGIVDGDDHATGQPEPYTLLPVVIRIRWDGAMGQRETFFTTQLVDR